MGCRSDTRIICDIIDTLKDIQTSIDDSMELFDIDTIESLLHYINNSLAAVYDDIEEYRQGKLNETKDTV